MQLLQAALFASLSARCALALPHLTNAISGQPAASTELPGCHHRKNGTEHHNGTHHNGTRHHGCHDGLETLPAVPIPEALAAALHIPCDSRDVGKQGSECLVDPDLILSLAGALNTSLPNINATRNLARREELADLPYLPIPDALATALNVTCNSHNGTLCYVKAATLASLPDVPMPQEMAKALPFIPCQHSGGADNFKCFVNPLILAELTAPLINATSGTEHHKRDAPLSNAALVKDFENADEVSINFPQDCPEADSAHPKPCPLTEDQKDFQEKVAKLWNATHPHAPSPIKAHPRDLPLNKTDPVDNKLAFSQYGWIGSFDSDTCSGDPVSGPRPKLYANCVPFTPSTDNIGISWGGWPIGVSSLHVYASNDCTGMAITTWQAPQNSIGPGSCIDVGSLGNHTMGSLITGDTD